MTAPPFGDLVLEARRGSVAAIGALFRRYEARLVAYFRTWAPEEAEDLAMDVWVAVASGFDRFSGDETDFRRWLFTIARHRLIDAKRKRHRRRTDPVSPGGIAGPPDSTDTAATAIGRVDTERMLAFVVDHLTPLQAEVVVLRIVADLPAEDVGRVIGRDASAIRAVQRRALQQLARKLGDAL